MFVDKLVSIFICLCADFSSRHKDREEGRKEQYRPGSVKHYAWTKRKFHEDEIPVEVQPTHQSSTTKILHSSIDVGKVPTTFVNHHIETSTRSLLETRKAADPLQKSPTRTFGPASDPSTKKKETAVYNDSGKKNSTTRNRRWHEKNGTRSMSDRLSLPTYHSPESREPATVGAGVIFSPHFHHDKTTTYDFSLSTTSNIVGEGLNNRSHSFFFKDN